MAKILSRGLLTVSEVVELRRTSSTNLEKESTTIKKFCQINVYSGPWDPGIFPFPWSSSRRSQSGHLADGARLNFICDCLIQTRPPHVAPCQSLHSVDPWVTLMKNFQDTRSEQLRNDYSGAPQQTPFKHA
uniref:Uncharacterized protein n=1 Tax=Micrurus lemniscatus lemniscatus TaxID=129467 RepID=A0A2D4ILW0_MICLE